LFALLPSEVTCGKAAVIRSLAAAVIGVARYFADFKTKFYVGHFIEHFTFTIFIEYFTFSEFSSEQKLKVQNLKY
jgi:hypothetical protein